MSKYLIENSYLQKIPKNPICEKVDMSEIGRKVSASIIWNSFKRKSMMIVKNTKIQTASSKEENCQYFILCPGQEKVNESEDSTDQKGSSDEEEEEYGDFFKRFSNKLQSISPKQGELCGLSLKNLFEVF